MLNCKCSLCLFSTYKNMSTCPICESSLYLDQYSKDIFCKNHFLHFNNNIVIYLPHNNTHIRAIISNDTSIISIYDPNYLIYDDLAVINNIASIDYIIKHIKTIINFSWIHAPFVNLFFYYLIINTRAPILTSIIITFPSISSFLIITVS